MPQLSSHIENENSYIATNIVFSLIMGTVHWIWLDYILQNGYMPNSVPTATSTLCKRIERCMLAQSVCLSVCQLVVVAHSVGNSRCLIMEL